MSEGEKKYLITFKVTAMAYKFENYCDKKELDVKLVPVPSKLSDSCGYASRIHKEDVEEIKELCENKNIEYGDIYKEDEYNKLIKNK